MPNCSSSAEKFLQLAESRRLGSTTDHLHSLADMAINAIAEHNPSTVLAALRGLKHCFDKLRTTLDLEKDELHNTLEILKLQKDNAELQLMLLQLLTTQRGTDEEAQRGIVALQNYLEEANPRLEALTLASIADLDPELR